MANTKVLLLGLGRWGANHLRVLRTLPVELFVADPQPKALESARKAGVAADHLASDHRQFAERVGAAVVVTPVQAHYPLCLELLRGGKDLLVEKPITTTSAEAKELSELAARQGRILQVGHIFRFDTATQWLKQALDEGKFGAVRLLRANFSGFKRPRNDSGVTYADAIHFVDMFNFLLGGAPRRVTAVTQDFLGRGPGFDDASIMSLEYATRAGAVWGVIETNNFVPGKFRELTIIGSDLSAVCDFNVAQYKIRTFANRHQREGADFKAVEGALTQVECAPVEPLLAELQAFLHSIATRERPSADGWAGYESVRVLEAATESARTGRSVSLG